MSLPPLLTPPLSPQSSIPSCSLSLPECRDSLKNEIRMFEESLLKQREIIWQSQCDMFMSLFRSPPPVPKKKGKKNCHNLNKS